MSDELKPKLDDFTAKVVSDPAKPQDTLLLQGFLGASSQPDHTRVYSDLTLSSYVDVANVDIIHIEPLSKEQSPMGGSYLWVKKEAEVLPAAAPGEVSAKAKFLQGPIASEAAGVASPAKLPVTVPVVACHATIVLQECFPTRFPQCFVTRIVCPTRPVVCDIAVSGTGPCKIPDPTIWQQTPQFQGGAFAAPHAQAPGAAAPDLGRFPSLSCPTAFCPQPTQVGTHCVPHTPGCPQLVPQTTTAPCHVTLSASVCAVCPSVQIVHCPTFVPAQCPPSVPPIHCPVSVAPVHCPSFIPVQCPPSLVPVNCPVSAHPANCPPSVHPAACPSLPVHCPPTIPPVACQTNVVFCGQTVGHPGCPVATAAACPVVRAACPQQPGGPVQFGMAAAPQAQAFAVTVAGTVCQTVHCPTPRHQCPSVNQFHCPSVNNFQCPKTSHAAGCPPTPNIQHCPTPNMICPLPTPNCPSVMEICPTTSPLFC